MWGAGEEERSRCRRGEVAARRGEWEEMVEEEETSTTSMGEEVIRSRVGRGGLERRTEGGVTRAMVDRLLVAGISQGGQD